MSINITVRSRTTLLSYIYILVHPAISGNFSLLLDTSVFYVSIDFENGSLSYIVHKSASQD